MPGTGLRPASRKNYNVPSLILAPPPQFSKFRERGSVYRMGRAPIQIDVINEDDGIDIRDAHARRQVVRVDDIEISLISREDLNACKKASGRLQDLTDIVKLA